MSDDIAGHDLTDVELEDILRGATFLGSGGGGPVALGQQMLDHIRTVGKPVFLADPASIPATASGAIAAGVGSPIAAASGFPMAALGTAWNRLQAGGARLDVVVPAEVGAGNTFIPFIVAAEQGLPVIDGAGADRAVPKLPMVSFYGAGLPVGDVVLANATQWFEFVADTADHADVAMRAVMDGGLFDEDAGAALWRMTGADISKHAISGVTTRLSKAGRLLRESTDRLAAIEGELGGTVVVRGTITEVVDPTSGGFDAGHVVIESAVGTTRYTVLTVNENVAVFSSDQPEPLFVAPDLLCYLLADGTPFSNAEAADHVGKEMVLVRFQAAPELYEPLLLAEFDTLLQSLGQWGRIKR
jgi:DUF917 family protein